MIFSAEQGLQSLDWKHKKRRPGWQGGRGHGQNIPKMRAFRLCFKMNKALGWEAFLRSTVDFAL